MSLTPFCATKKRGCGVGDLASVTVAAHRQILDHVWRPAIGGMSLFAVRYSTLIEVAEAASLPTKKTYNNAISALRRRDWRSERPSSSTRPAH